MRYERYISGRSCCRSSSCCRSRSGCMQLLLQFQLAACSYTSWHVVACSYTPPHKIRAQNFALSPQSLTFAPQTRPGEMVEWSITTVLKTVVPRGTGGSNPSLSATNAENQQIAKQTPSFAPKNVKSGVFVLFKIIQPLHNKRVAILKESDEKRLIFIYPFTLIFQDFTSS